MGVVYLVREEATGQLRALKTLSLVGDSRALARMRREGHAQAQVDRHPNIVRVHSAGEVDGCAYLVQDFVPGGDLKARLREGPLSPEEAVRVVAAVGRGLAHAHRHGVLHRDIKPANVLLDADGTPRLGDFGLARAEGELTLTRTGEALGTPAFMAPEQVESARTVDARSDVYGLGGLLFAALTGEPPVDGDNPNELLVKVLLKHPRAPSSLRPDVPAALDAICLRALAKDPAERFQTADEMVQALEATLAAPARRAPSRRALVTAAFTVGLSAAALGWLLAPAAPTPAGPSAPTPSTAATPSTVQAAPAARWWLEPGQALRCELRLLERNDRGFEARVVGVLDLRVEARSGDGWRLSSTWVLGEAVMGNAGEDMARIPVNQDALDVALDQRVLTLHLDPLTGRVSRLEGLGELRRAILARVQRTVFDLDRESHGQALVRQLYDEAVLTRLLDPVFALFADDSPWDEVAPGELRALQRDLRVAPLPLLLARPGPGPSYRFTGTATFRGGLLRSARVEQAATNGLLTVLDLQVSTP
jgi:hypothetical protein